MNVPRHTSACASSVTSATVLIRVRFSVPDSTGRSACRAASLSWQEAVSRPRAGARNSSAAAAPSGSTPRISSSASQAAMMAARPAASASVIRPLECSEPMTLVSVGWTASVTWAAPSAARRTSRPAAACAGTGSISVRASVVTSMDRRVWQARLTGA